MFEQLFNLVKENAQEDIVNNPVIPNEQNEAVMQEASSSITSTLQSLLASGNSKDVFALFNSQPDQVPAQPAMQQISGNFISSLTEKFGISGAQASGLAGSLIPNILGKLIGKTNDPSDNSFSIQDIFNKLSNNGTSGLNIPGMLSKFAGGGLDKDGDGDVDFNDLTAAFSGATKQTGAGTQSGGGILDTLKGMLGGK